MSIERSNYILVGIDGSAPSLSAALWAADEAHRRKAELHLLHAYTLPTMGVPGAVMMAADLSESVRAAGQELLDQVGVAVRVRHPDLEIHTTLSFDAAVDLLRDKAEHALMLVVGTKAEHEFVEAVFGTVASRLAGHTRCPVVVIREGTESNDTTGPVVIGLDGTESCEGALAFAFEEASLRSVELVAVHSWDDSVLNGFQRVYPLLVDRAVIDDDERRVLAEQLAGWADQYPDVDVKSVVLRGKSDVGLTRVDPVSLAVPALIVVGTRGAGRFAAVVTGSTSRELLAHSPSPVAVVRGEYADGHGPQNRAATPVGTAQ